MTTVQPGKPTTATHLLALLLTVLSGNLQAGLNYSCEDLASMAARFYALKDAGHTLDDVLSVIHKASAKNPDKETLLSNVAIEIYVDPSIGSAQQARDMARSQCTLQVAQ